jgi:para-aminobenzoate synthetase component I
MPVLVRPIPYRDPVAAFAAVREEAMPVLLDSAADARGTGRWSFVAADPYATVTDADGNPFDALERALKPFAQEPVPVPFAGGAIGFLGYEAGRHLERLPEPLPDPLGFPEAAFGLYDVVAAFDHVQGEAWIVSTGRPETEPAKRMQRARERADRLAALLDNAPVLPPLDWTLTARWAAEQTRDAAEARIARTIEYIRAGDIFQANITQRMLADLPEGLDAFTLYRRLRALSPAPFAAFLDLGAGRAVVSASPERFLRLAPGGFVETRPIKGTRRRDPDPARDAALAAELAASVKDRAENLMICDLMRNDLARVCRVGSVRVPVLHGLETFASVHHLVSVVEGRLRDGLGPVDLLRATFPGGSITGAPKIRAMEIIRELEPARRGAYCGSVAWIGFDGVMDSSIVIRTLTVAGNTVVAQAGGGIVADSDPADEVDEAMTKLRPLLRAVEGPG